jgi:hypothetical protein
MTQGAREGQLIASPLFTSLSTILVRGQGIIGTFFGSVFHKYSNEKQKCTMGRYQHNIRLRHLPYEDIRRLPCDLSFRKAKV